MQRYASVPKFNDYEGFGRFFSQPARMLGQVLRRTKHCCHSRNLCLELSLDRGYIGVYKDHGKNKETTIRVSGFPKLGIHLKGVKSFYSIGDIWFRVSGFSRLGLYSVPLLERDRGIWAV